MRPLACVPDWCVLFLTVGLKRDSRQLSKYIVVLKERNEGNCLNATPKNGIRVNICESISSFIEHSTQEYINVFK